MRRTEYFLPTLKETPAEAHIASHRLMLRAAMIHQTTAGIYSWLPFGQRVLEKLIKIVAEEQDRIGCHRIIMPTIQPASLWQESGRFEDYGKEMLRIKDRHERDMLYGPTHEEVVTDIARQYLKSYRDLPQVLYQINWKFRDEIRPRFGVMRGREFMMKDGYSFDVDFEGARSIYEKIYNSYLKTFNRMRLRAIPVRADSGAIGGDLSHEFHIVAETGESAIYYDNGFDNLKTEERTYECMQGLYAAADEKHVPDQCPIPLERIKTARGIEIGHIFYFGTKYSKSMNFTVMGPDGKPIYPEMGSYGIGVSRLVGAIVEANHDEKGIIWPEPVAPFHVGLINVKAADSKLVAIAEDLYQRFLNYDVDVLYDDRDERAGAKFSDMDLIGLPWQIVIGNKTQETGCVELKNRRTSECLNLSIEDAFSKVISPQ